MEMLFGKAGADVSAELKASLGFIDADLPLKKIKPDLRTATSDLIEIIGQETYDNILTEYKKTEITAIDLVELSQYAVATLAYRLYAPANDLQHGANGRKMLTSDDSKTPFEHMLVASDDELERRSHRAMDGLINFLDANNDIWKASVNYIESHRLFLRTTKEFDSFFVLESRYLLLKLQTGMETFEKREILSRIGLDLFSSIKMKRSGEDSDDLTELEESLLPLIQGACAYGSLSWGIPRLQANLFPKGTLQATRAGRSNVKGRTPFAGSQIDQISQLYNQDTQDQLLEIEKIITAQIPVEDDSDPVVIISEYDEDDNFAST